MKIFIDDERRMPEGYDILARTNQDAIRALKEIHRDGRMKLELVSFDYDAHNYLSWTFMQTAEWMRDHDVWPEEIRIHTLNHWKGRPELIAFFKENAPTTTKVDPYDPWAAVLDPNAPEWVTPFLEAQQFGGPR